MGRRCATVTQNCSSQAWLSLDHIVFEITYRCNLNCSICYVSAGREHQDPPLAQTLAILDRIAAAGCKEVLIGGGEPAIRSDLVNILEYGHARGLSQTLVTNGTIASTRRVAEIARFCKNVDISIRGLDRTQFEQITRVAGSFRNMWNGLRMFAQSGTVLNLNYDLNPTNVHCFYETMQLATSEGIKVFTVWLQRLSARGRAIELTRNSSREMLGLEDYLDVLEQMRQAEIDFGIRCLFVDPLPLCFIPPRYAEFVMPSKYGYTWAAIDPYGNLRRDPVDPSCVVGNVLQADVLQLWNTSVQLKRFRSLEWLPDSCKTCTLASICRSGFVSSSPSKADGDSYAPDVLLDCYSHLVRPFGENREELSTQWLMTRPDTD